VTASSPANHAATSRLPVLGLLALATASFVSIMTEALPAGLLPQMSRDLGVSEAAAGQFVTIYAIASVIVAVPVTAMTQGLRRKPLLMTAISGFAAGNIVTSISNDYALTLAARFCAGAGAGLLWALLPGYASRMAPPNLRGRAIAIAMVGVSVAMSIGVPAGTFVSKAIGWHATFGVLSAFALGLIARIIFGVPDFPGLAAGKRASVRQVIANPGVRAVLMITFTFVLAHNILYTYIAPFVVPAGLGERVDLVLLIFGFAAICGHLDHGAPGRPLAAAAHPGEQPHLRGRFAGAGPGGTRTDSCLHQRRGLGDRLRRLRHAVPDGAGHRGRRRRRCRAIAAGGHVELLHFGRRRHRGTSSQPGRRRVVLVDASAAAHYLFRDHRPDEAVLDHQGPMTSDYISDVHCKKCPLIQSSCRKMRLSA
jgi:MFS family permease